jgi:regulator of ribonuclease activity A
VKTDKKDKPEGRAFEASRAISTLKTTDLSDYYPETQTCQIQFLIRGKRRAFHGRIRTVKCFEDNVLLKKLVSQPTNGDVLVVDGGASLGCALMGDVIASLAAKNGWSGAVIHGAIRDVLAIDQIDFGVKALGSNPKRCGKTGAGEVDVPVSFGGVTFVPGHWLYSDEDGVLVSENRLVT